MEKMFCIDCKKEVEVKVYNDKVDPPILYCAECYQFVYDEDQPFTASDMLKQNEDWHKRNSLVTKD